MLYHKKQLSMINDLYYVNFCSGLLSNAFFRHRMLQNRLRLEIYLLWWKSVHCVCRAWSRRRLTSVRRLKMNSSWHLRSTAIWYIFTICGSGADGANCTSGNFNPFEFFCPQNVAFNSAKSNDNVHHFGKFRGKIDIFWTLCFLHRKFAAVFKKIAKNCFRL